MTHYTLYTFYKKDMAYVPSVTDLFRAGRHVYMCTAQLDAYIRGIRIY